MSSTPSPASTDKPGPRAQANKHTGTGKLDRMESACKHRQAETARAGARWPRAHAVRAAASPRPSPAHCVCRPACACSCWLEWADRGAGTLPKAKSWPLRARLLPNGPLSAAKAGSTWTREATQGGATRANACRQLDANACRQLDANACRQAAPGSLARALAAAWVDLPARYLAGSIAVEICPLRGTLLSPSSEGRHRARALQHPSSSVSVRAHSGPSRLATHCLQPHPAGAAPGAPCSVARRGGSDAMHGGAGRLLTRPSFASSC
jgi:hypothetical protein